ncbi:hypothetical protein EJB05_54280, partial [Eragrostis curvula]
MAADGGGDNPVVVSCRDLPEAIIIWDILVRLPPEDVFRCRAVRKSWRHATSTRDFLLAHHRRQPALPIINLFDDPGHRGDAGTTIRVEDHRLVVFGGGGRELRPLVRYAAPARDCLALHGARDGLLLVSTTGLNAIWRRFYLCNPATRRSAPVRHLLEPRPGRPCFSTHVVGFYQHQPSGEYRVMYWFKPESDDGVGAPVYYVLTVWNGGEPSHILAFDTVSETFRWMRRPARYWVRLTLLETKDGDGTTGLCLCGTTEGRVIEFWVLEDYEAEIWSLKHRIKLEALEPSPSPPVSPYTLVCSNVKVAVFNEGEVLISVAGRVLHCDFHGNFFRFLECGGGLCSITGYSLRESILRHPFFEMQEEIAVNDMPMPFLLGTEQKTRLKIYSVRPKDQNQVIDSLGLGILAVLYSILEPFPGSYNSLSLLEQVKGTMAADGSGDNTVAASCKDLPEAIIIWEILVRLPPEDVFRCRAVRRSWRDATSTRDFLLAHHRRQPALPIVNLFADREGGGVRSAEDPRLVVLGGGELRPLVRYAAPAKNCLALHGARDGLLLVSSTRVNASWRRFYLCCRK